MHRPILRVAVPSPLHRTFDYLPPAGAESPPPGVRVRVPFGRREAIGVVVEVAEASGVEPERLKPVVEILDRTPLFAGELAALLSWACDYYHHPPGEVYAAALPVMMREGGGDGPRRHRRYRLTAEGRGIDPATLGRAVRQTAMLGLLAARPEGLEEGGPETAGAGETLRRLVERGWVEVEEIAPFAPGPRTPQPAPDLNEAQRAALAAVMERLGTFHPFLLDGVTGSGKTEVYLGAVAEVTGRGRQALLLVPEIGLTPQLVERVRRRLAAPVALLHSGLAEGERAAAWQAARSGEAGVIIGTRSALFTPFRDLGLIVVDEEHDPSFKQQEGFRYSARDGAVMRARLAGVPVVLGSATPSLESLHNARRGHYTRLSLPERAGNASHPAIRVIDLRAQPLDNGLSPPLLQAIEAHLGRGGQALLFLNRRGYAPALLCHECGHVFDCRRCDSPLTLHAGDRRLRCHHCGGDHPVPRQCPACGSPDLRPVGRGTERLEEALAARFGEGVVRIDRDSTRRKGSLQALFDQVHEGAARLLVGTQMIAKGHHFPNVTLVGIVDGDRGLFSADFRAPERVAQLIVQVAGRAGRADRPGEVIIQTHHPDHPLLKHLVEEGYAAFAAAALEERRLAELPPFSHLALLRAEAVDARTAEAFLKAAAAGASGHEGVSLWGPVPAPMERRAGRFRAQLLLQARRRSDLHGLLREWTPSLAALKEARRVRWSLDVDPAELL